ATPAHQWYPRETQKLKSKPNGIPLFSAAISHTPPLNSPPHPTPLHQPRARTARNMPMPAIIDDLLPEFFIRLPTPEDLARVAATCASFRQAATDRACTREFRRLHAP
uniref:F-box domain-containing protein n=1 Tax=Aegilops tauschii subsp. strangulata TaxID=200361 RepID=A0A453RP42_AEGTS